LVLSREVLSCPVAAKKLKFAPAHGAAAAYKTNVAAGLSRSMPSHVNGNVPRLFLTAGDRNTCIRPTSGYSAARNDFSAARFDNSRYEITAIVFVYVYALRSNKSEHGIDVTGSGHLLGMFEHLIRRHRLPGRAARCLVRSSSAAAVPTTAETTTAETTPTAAETTATAAAAAAKAAAKEASSQAGAATADSCCTRGGAKAATDGRRTNPETRREAAHAGSHLAAADAAHQEVV
jgi:hypothetical protein